MRTRQLGSTGPVVSELGLGCMGMSDLYGPADRNEGIATIHAALDAGITLLDTGDFYGMGTNELLVREALANRDRSKVILSVKFGALRDPEGAFLGYDGRPNAVKNFLTYSLRRLGTDYIDIYRLSRVDPNVPIEETVGAIAEMIAKRIRAPRRALGGGRGDDSPRACGASNLRSADRVLALFAQYRAGDPAGHARARDQHHRVRRARARSPEWQLDRKAARARATAARIIHASRASNLAQNLALVEALRGVASERGATVAQLAIAWVASRGDGHSPAHRLAAAAAARGGARRARRHALERRSRANRARGTGTTPPRAIGIRPR